MNKPTILFLLALAFAPITALADTLTLKCSQIAALDNAHAALDGAPRVVTTKERDGSKSESVVPVPYEFSGKTRLAIARNLVAIRPAVQALEAAKNALFKQVAGSDVVELKDPAKLVLFDKLWSEALDQPVTVDLQRISEAELNLEKNAIPGTTLKGLAPIVPELADAVPRAPETVAKK